MGYEVKRKTYIESGNITRVRVYREHPYADFELIIPGNHERLSDYEVHEHIRNWFFKETNAGEYIVELEARVERKIDELNKAIEKVESRHLKESDGEKIVEDLPEADLDLSIEDVDLGEVDLADVELGLDESADAALEEGADSDE